MTLANRYDLTERMQMCHRAVCEDAVISAYMVMMESIVSDSPCRGLIVLEDGSATLKEVELSAKLKYIMGKIEERKLEIMKHFGVEEVMEVAA